MGNQNLIPSTFSENPPPVVAHTNQKIDINVMLNLNVYDDGILPPGVLLVIVFGEIMNFTNTKEAKETLVLNRTYWFLRWALLLILIFLNSHVMASNTEDFIENLKKSGNENDCAHNPLISESFHLVADERYEKAINILSRVIKESPNCRVALQQRAFSYYRLGKYENARKDIDRAVKFSYVGPAPGSTRIIHIGADCYVWAAEIYSKLKLYDKAAEFRTKFFQNRDPSLNDYTTRAEDYYHAGQTNNALADLNTTINANKFASAKTYCLRGLCMEQKGMLEQSLLDFQKALKMIPDPAPLNEDPKINYYKPIYIEASAGVKRLKTKLDSKQHKSN